MSIIVEFSIDKEELALGRALAGTGDASIELEQIVPAETTLIPFFWIEYPDTDGLEGSINESDYVKNLTRLDTVGTRTLYKVEWTGKHEDLFDGIVDADGTIIETTSDGAWQFIVRFPDHDHVGQFYNFCTGHSIPVHIDRTYSLTEDSLHKQMYGLTNEQREAIELALKRGYFETPRAVKMQELADELGISQQSFSERLRRGNEKVLETIYL